MPLGEHLHELRRRLLLVLAVLMVAMIVGFAFQSRLKVLVGQPLRMALSWLEPETAKRLGLTLDPDTPMLVVLSLPESAINAVKVSLLAAFMIAFPTLIHQLWAFIRPGLRRQERNAGFLMLPAAVLFFYGGVAFGYAVGLPYCYFWLMEWTAHDSTVVFQLRQSYYYNFFIMMTVCFGLIMDIPWVILVLVRVGVVTPAQIASQRKVLLFGGAVFAALMTPPDPVSQIAVLLLMWGLFESGLLLSRVLFRQRAKRAVADAEPEPPQEDADSGAVARPDPWSEGDDDAER